MRNIVTLFLTISLFLSHSGTGLGDSYTTSKGQIYHNSNCIELFGINWFGFETTDHVVHGLWARNYKDMIGQMKNLGFNAVRIPFCPEPSENIDIISGLINYTENTDLAGLKSLEILDKVMDELNSQEMYILLDHHRPDCANISDLWYTDSYSEEQWINDLVFVAERYKNKSYFLGLDLKNEPHGQATWGTGNDDTDWDSAAERAAQAVLAANPDILIFVEGIEENTGCSTSGGHFWGGNLQPQSCYNISTASNKLVFSPHVYGPDVFDMTYFNDSEFPDNMPLIWDTHFGYLFGYLSTRDDYTLAPGEFGGQYGHICTSDSEADSRGVTWEDAVVDYFLVKLDVQVFLS